jgi:acetolactate synthase I/II/III large subunit
LNKGDKIICSSAISSMGTGLAETIGVSKSSEFLKYICIIGDGSFLMNIQDLQTIRQDNINVVICVINNNGYLAIRHTQNQFLEGRLHGTHPDWNLTMPSFEKVADTFNFKYIKLDRSIDTDKIIHVLSDIQEPTICEVVVDENKNVLFNQEYVDNKDGTFSPQPLFEMAYYES